MSTVGLKLGSLVIRTLSKPIANAIKDRARDHPRFRKLCISIAQTIHRADMRFRLSILRDAAATERLEATKKSASKSSTSFFSAKNVNSTMRPSATHTAALSKVGGHVPTSPTTHPSTLTPARYHIRPLSEAKAIERGASFISEFFIFSIASSLILLESVRAWRKENARRDIIAERLELLEERSAQDEARIKTLEEEVWGLKGGKSGELQVVEPSPLWEGMEKKPGFLGGLWRRIIGQSSLGITPSVD